MRKLLFIDRDGTLIQEPEDEQIDSWSKFEFLPELFQALGQVARSGEYDLVMVTNQDGLGSPAYPQAIFDELQAFLLKTLEGEGIRFEEILIDTSTAAQPSANRKPATGMLQHYLKGPYDLAHSFVIGDRRSDVELAKNLGAKSIFIGETIEEADFCSKSWSEIARYLLQEDRKVELIRRTRETEIELSLNLDGQGQSQINTGLPFFDHMLDQIVRHGDLDLSLQCKGDLEVDEHHTIEDVALALGQAMKQALGKSKGLQRYAFVLPMDESEAKVSLDLGGRPNLVWKAQFKREMIGGMPTEMFPHFFKSLSDTAALTLNIAAEGSNEHHKIEAIFKAFAQCLKKAKRRDTNGRIPSTKGML